METITTRTDLERWVFDCGTSPPTAGATDRVLDFIRERGFRWGDNIEDFPMEEDEYNALIWPETTTTQSETTTEPVQITEGDRTVTIYDGFSWQDEIPVCHECGQDIRNHGLCEDCDDVAETVLDDTCECWREGDLVKALCRTCMAHYIVRP